MDQFRAHTHNSSNSVCPPERLFSTAFSPSTHRHTHTGSTIAIVLYASDAMVIVLPICIAFTSAGRCVYVLLCPQRIAVEGGVRLPEPIHTAAPLLLLRAVTFPVKHSLGV